MPVMFCTIYFALGVLLGAVLFSSPRQTAPQIIVVPYAYSLPVIVVKNGDVESVTEKV